ncbi:cytochrome P450 [Natronomonas halophila]|uniref:cytochrome P450 n=1 Tax=Natronomonas halophila TaxID=2747817 RepID=UPI0015B73B3B|nr:cytochrome P450 [Natronomonas halophila]QLD86738.1 cytochrome P450 [Natronomonas halophila]
MREPPGPTGLPIVGNTFALARGQGAYLERVADRYGRVASLYMVGIGDVALVSDPDLVEEVLFSERYTKASVGREVLSELLGDGLVLSEGDLWERQRQLIQPAFTSERIERYAETMADRAAAFADRLEPGRTYDIGEELRKVTLRILFETIFGSDIDYEGLDLGETFEHITSPGNPLNQPVSFAVPKWVPIPMWRRYNAAVEKLERKVYDLIERRRAEGPGDDLISTLLAAGDGAMSDEQLRDEVMTMLFAGHETTATALTFTFHLLGTHPDVDDRLAAELDDVLGGRPPTPADRPDLEVTKRVLQESLRLYPPVPALGREPTTETELGGYRLTPDTSMLLSQWVIHHDADRYEAPDAFQPERWQRKPVDERHRFAYFPFGGGPRRCIGEAFAMAEATLLLAAVASRYRLEPVDSSPLSPSVSIVTQPTRDVKMVPRRR